MATKTRRQREKRRESTARRRANKREKGRGAKYLKMPDDVKLWKPSKGQRIIDIVPFVAGPGNPDADEGELADARTIYVHRNIGPDNERESYLCNHKTLDEECGACKAIAKLSRVDLDGKADELEEFLEAIKIKERQLRWVFDHEEPKEGLQLADISFYLFGELLEETLDDTQPDSDFFYLPGDEGLSLEIKVREKSYEKATYFEISDIEFVERDFKYPKGIWDDVPCLDDELLVPHKPEKLSALITGLWIEDEEEEEEERPRRRSRRQEPEDVDDDPDDEPAESNAEFEVGDRVEFTYRNKTLIGKIVDLDEDAEMYSIETPERSRPYNIEWDDDTLKTAPDVDEDEEEDDPPKKSRRGRKSREDDENEDDEPKAKGRSGRRRTTKSRSDDDEEDDPPKKSRRGTKSGKQSRTTGKSSGKKDATDECPEGGEFGVDTDQLEGCATCDLWDACDDAKNG